MLTVCKLCADLGVVYVRNEYWSGPGSVGHEIEPEDCPRLSETGHPSKIVDRVSRLEESTKPSKGRLAFGPRGASGAFFAAAHGDHPRDGYLYEGCAGCATFRAGS